MWRDIFLANREAIERELEAYVAELERLIALLRAGDADAIERWIEGARADRQRLLELELAGGPVSELRVSVPNRPGIVAQHRAGAGRGRREHRRHGALPGGRHAVRRDRALGRGRPRAPSGRSS